MGSIPKGKSLDTHRVQCRCPVTRMRFFFAFFLCGYTPKDTRGGFRGHGTVGRVRGGL